MVVLKWDHLNNPIANIHLFSPVQGITITVSVAIVINGAPYAVASVAHECAMMCAIVRNSYFVLAAQPWLYKLYQFYKLNALSMNSGQVRHSLRTGPGLHYSARSTACTAGPAEHCTLIVSWPALHQARLELHRQNCTHKLVSKTCEATQ